MHKVAQVLIGGGSKPKAPKVVVPPVKPPAEIPDENTVKLNAMKAEAMQRRSGRASTILDDEDKLGS